jgi:hypothetical protein
VVGLSSGMYLAGMSLALSVFRKYS